MNNEEFFKYSHECNKDIPRKSEEIEKMRESKLFATSGKVIEIADFIKSNSPFKMLFNVCLDKRFYKYDRSWCDIYLKEQNIYIFVVHNQEERDIIFQIWRRKNIVIVDYSSSIEEISQQITDKMIKITEINNKKNGK